MHCFTCCISEVDGIIVCVGQRTVHMLQFVQFSYLPLVPGYTPFTQISLHVVQTSYPFKAFMQPLLCTVGCSSEILFATFFMIIDVTMFYHSHLFHHISILSKSLLIYFQLLFFIFSRCPAPNDKNGE